MEEEWQDICVTYCCITNYCKTLYLQSHSSCALWIQEQLSWVVFAQSLLRGWGPTLARAIVIQRPDGSWGSTSKHSSWLLGACVSFLLSLLSSWVFPLWCLRVLTTWHLAFPRARVPRAQGRDYARMRISEDRVHLESWLPQHLKRDIYIYIYRHKVANSFEKLRIKYWPLI